MSLHLILVSDRLTTAKTLTLTTRHLIAAASLLAATILILSSFFSYLTVRHAADIQLPFLKTLLRSMTLEETQRSTVFVRENINAMAVKLGEMQAQLIRLDTLGERLAGLAGVKAQDLRNIEFSRDGRGGPLLQPESMTPGDLQRAVNELTRTVEAKTDALSLIESQLLEERIKKSLLPTGLPVEASWNASSYGWRVDPFTGQRAMHEGVDFPAEVGASIRAAAAGVVIGSERHPEYGNVVEIDHGKDLITRYAHASKVLVVPGAFVKRGQKIAEVGSTGRSTGPHLHFEVRLHGAPQNPDRFLRLAQAEQKSLASR
jgi:murein DD-endopeptidase MepM/ murein hydrolase activator NlpD